jgi:hypothetical protein
MGTTGRLLGITLLAVTFGACSGTPSHTNVSNIGSPDKSSLPTPEANGTNRYSANANNPQRNAAGESQATNTAGANTNVR